MEKDYIRQKILKQRDLLSAKDRMKLDISINEKLYQAISKAAPKSVHVFVPMSKEVDILPTIMKLLADNIKVVTSETLPDRKLKHWKLSSLDTLVDGLNGTKYPSDRQPFDDSFDIILTPGLAFTEEGERIGYGGGYYDAFLKDHPDALKIGVCYNFQVYKTLPQDDFDICVDTLIYS